MEPVLILFTAAVLSITTGCTTTCTVDLSEPTTHLRYELTLDDDRRVMATEMTTTSDF